MTDYRVFDKVKDVETLKRMYEAEKKKAASVLEIKIIDAAARRALMRIRGLDGGEGITGKG